VTGFYCHNYTGAKVKTWMVRNSHGQMVESPATTLTSLAPDDDDPARLEYLDAVRQALADAWLDGYQNGAGDPYFAPADDEDVERRAKAYAAEEMP
jgi:hypothetical protein